MAKYFLFRHADAAGGGMPMYFSDAAFARNRCTRDVQDVYPAMHRSWHSVTQQQGLMRLLLLRMLLL
jgi:hypothetical protein